MHRLAARVRGQGFGAGVAGAGAGAVQAYRGVYPYASDYDGTNDYATRGAVLTGSADGKQGTVSIWHRIDGGDGAVRVLLGDATTVGGATARIGLYFNTDNKLYVDAYNAAGVLIMRLGTVTAYTAGATWRHFIYSWDLTSVGKRHLYVTDVSDIAAPTYTNDTIDYTTADFSVGALASGGSKANGCISELFFHPTYIDLSVEANRRKFITATGKPAFLGANGSLPLGVQPLLYAPDGNPVTNRGSGGNFTLTGSLDAASTTPF